jgi:hypothetical protein
MIKQTSFFLLLILSFVFSQSDLEKGIQYYNLRHKDCVEDKADPEPITEAVSYFEKALVNQIDKDEAALYL